VPGLKKLRSWTSIESRHEDSLVTNSPLSFVASRRLRQSLVEGVPDAPPIRTLARLGMRSNSVNFPTPSSLALMFMAAMQQCET